MRKFAHKKLFSIILALSLLLSSIPFAAVSAEEVYPVMKSYASAPALKEDYHYYKESVVSVTFLDEIDNADVNAAETIESWDVSVNGDNSVIAWMKLNAAATSAAGANRYDVFVAADGGVGANPDLSNFFYNFINLKEINGFENFKTDKVTSFYCFFENCSSLECIDLSSLDTSNVTNMSYLFSYCGALTDVNLSGWDTSNVTNMSFMFNNCIALPMLDISSFDTSKVTNMQRMFYRCELLKKLYTGEKWTVEQVTNSNAMFNCCYVIEGKLSYNYNAVNDKQFATTEGYLTDVAEKPQPEKKEYTVTYSFTGDVIPDGISVVPSVTYEEGTIVKVADAFVADGYIFSGWKTTDAVVVDGEFVINSNVEFTGEWIKVYNVSYVYLADFDVPAGAPALPEAVAYPVGETVDINDIPFVDGFVFVGWGTDDVSVIDGKKFSMPENDVILYGYFKKPVESVEINGGDIVLDKDSETVINVIVKPEDATIKDILYESSDENVVIVDNNGKIIAVGEGSAIITVVAKDDPAKRDTINVTVKIPVEEIIVEKNQITLDSGNTDKIIANVVPEEASNKKVIYQSDDESVVTVDENGNITAVSEGTAIITVTSVDDPTISKIVTVTVKNPVTDITAAEDFILNVDDVKNVDAKVNDDATNKKLIYESSDPAVAKVDIDGNVIARAPGVAIITVTSVDNPAIKETITVTVKISVENVEADKTEYELSVGETDEIKVTVTPDDATNKDVVYESSDETVVKVDEYGKITGVGEGTATITVTSVDNPAIKETITVTVTVHEESTTEESTTEETTTEETTTEETTTEESTTEEPTMEETTTEEPTTEEPTTEEPTTEEPTTEEPTTEEPTTEEPTTEEPSTDEPESPEYEIEVPESITVMIGQKINVGISISPDDGMLKPVFSSSNDRVVKVDADGNILGIGAGTADISVDFGNGEIRVIPVTVIALPIDSPKQYICFGKTDGIGWYEVSINGGDFFAQGPNSTLEVTEGSVLVIRVQDMWIDDEFDFYVNGKKIKVDAANTITVVVDGYMLIGALSMDVEVPDVEESLTFFEKIVQAIKAFFDWIAGLFK